MDKLFELQTRCVAHEIRNHISICDMYSEIIKKHLERSNYKNESVENALDCIKKSLKIIGTSLLDLKLASHLELKSCELKYLIEESIRLANAYTLGKNITIKSEIINSAIVNVDENKFMACIVNIIKNGIEAIEENGEINVSVDTKEDTAYIKISNNGKMIPLERQNEIFSEGFTTKPTGCGLGLHICKTHLSSQNAILKLIKSTDILTEFQIEISTLKKK